jgi:hypothetical protein
MPRSRRFPALVPLLTVLAAGCTNALPAGSGNTTSGGDAQSTSAATGGGATSGEIALPEGPPGVGFDDLRFSPELGPTAAGAHCATVDASGNVYVCAPSSGTIMTFHDAYPSSL